MNENEKCLCEGMAELSKQIVLKDVRIKDLEQQILTLDCKHRRSEEELAKQQAYIGRLEVAFLAYHEATFWKDEYVRTGRNISEEEGRERAKEALEKLRG